MSTPLLLTRSNVPIHSTSERGTPSLLHLGPFGPCQRPSKITLTKSPLLKSRRRATHIPPIVGHNPAVTTGQHFPPPIGYKFSYPVATTTPSKDDCLFGCPSPPSPVDHSGSGPPLSAREVSFSRVEAPSLKERPSAVHTRPFRVTCLIGSEGFSPTSESITSVGALRQYTPTSPTTIRVNDAYSDSVKSKFMPCSPTHSFTSRATLQKSQSTLIMPSLFTFFRPDAISPPGTGKQSRRDRLPRDISSRSLSTTSRSPSPLIRKCHTVTSLSSQGNQPPYTSTSANSVTPVQKKQKKLAFFRRISPSKSAVFSSQTRSQPSAPSSIRKSSSTAFALGVQRHRKASVISMVPHGELGNGMWPHKEHPEEEENSAPEGVLSEGRKDTSDAASIAGGCSRCASVGSIASRRLSTVTNGGGPDGIFCRLCLTDVSVRELYQLQLCQCRFCTYCMCMYATLKIREGEPVIECPDSNCDCRGEFTLEELESLVGKELVALHLKFRRDREVDLDPLKTWCPRPGCETVVKLSAPKMGGRPHCSCCPTCNTVFCAACSSSWHSGKPCLKNSGLYEVPLNDCIKRCPRCKVPIERDAGCAQMQCKKCKHVFCWYCLASLEDDFLLRHYDKGPCKNKLGHSRASVLLHRAQVVVIFAGFGLLLIIASPLLLFVGPCLLCKSCRSCSRPEMDEDVSNV